MRRTFKYRANCSKTVCEKSKQWLELCRQLYNACLEQRIDAFRRCGVSLSKFDQQLELKLLKQEFSEFSDIDSQVLKNVTDRLHKAYQNFFRRCKKGDNPGFPRFKGEGRYHSFTFPGPQGWALEGRYLTIKKLGRFKLTLHRPLEGSIRTVTLSLNGDGHWYVSFSCEDVHQKLLPKTGREVGIDVGLNHFLSDSDERKEENPRYFRQAEKDLAEANRSLSSKVHKSKNWYGARKKLSKTHARVANRRKDHAVKLAREYVRKYDFIVVEDLKIEKMVQARKFSKSISDAAWGSFFNWLHCKAEEAGKEVMNVDPRNTSKTCRICGHVQDMPLDVRVFQCDQCNHTEDRDIHSSKFILDRGRSLRRPRAENSLCTA